MKKIEQILSSGKVFSIDTTVCMQHAEVLRSYVRPHENTPWSNLPKPTQLAFKVAFISICHQFNWDYMQDTLAKKLLNKNINLISTLCEITAPILSNWLSGYEKQDRVRAKERAYLLRDVGKTLSTKFNNDLDLFYTSCMNAPLKNGDFHKLLDNFEGYRTDELRKKTNVLTHDLLKENIIVFGDKEHIEPAIDYHIMRLYLRTGRVIPTDESVLKYIEGSINPRGSLVRKLRETVAEAVKLVSMYSNLSVADINYIEWQIARNTCKNDLPACQSSLSPQNIPDDIIALYKDQCPYIETCWAKNIDNRFISFVEPVYISKNY